MTFKQLTLKILTPEGTAFEGPVAAVYLPGSLGSFEVLPGHAPIVSSLTKGEVRWRVDGSESALAVKGGAIMLKDNILTVCAQVGS